jgi:hypothetical protein
MQGLYKQWRYAPPHGRVVIGFVGVGLLATITVLAVEGAYGWLVASIGGLVAIEIAAWGLTVLMERGGVIARERLPRITPAILDRFYDQGYDPELGWIRKADTARQDTGGTTYAIDSRGSRRNPGHEELPLKISTYGDSYTFCREVADNETWQWYFSELTGVNLLNFGVGNYGFDQALIRLKRDYPRNPTPIVIMGVVPDTIARNLSVWKHYNEFGNILAFKPRYVLDGNSVRLVPNFIDSREKFFRIEEYLPDIQRLDYFYERRFLREAFRFPYTLSCLVQYRAVPLFVSKAARRLTHRFSWLEERLNDLVYGYLEPAAVLQLVALYRDSEAAGLLRAQIDAFVRYGDEKGFLPVLAMLPMRADLWFVQKHYNFYSEFLASVRSRILTIDAAEALLDAGPPSRLYRQWHYSPMGNAVVARTIVSELRARHPERLVETTDRTLASAE